MTISRRVKRNAAGTAVNQTVESFALSESKSMLGLARLIRVREMALRQLEVRYLEKMREVRHVRAELGRLRTALRTRSGADFQSGSVVLSNWAEYNGAINQSLRLEGAKLATHEAACELIRKELSQKALRKCALSRVFDKRWKEITCERNRTDQTWQAALAVQTWRQGTIMRTAPRSRPPEHSERQARSSRHVKAVFVDKGASSC